MRAWHQFPPAGAGGQRGGGKVRAGAEAGEGGSVRPPGQGQARRGQGGPRDGQQPPMTAVTRLQEQQALQVRGRGQG